MKLSGVGLNDTHAQPWSPPLCGVWVSIVLRDGDCLGTRSQPYVKQGNFVPKNRLQATCFMFRLYSEVRLFAKQPSNNWSRRKSQQHGSVRH